MDMGGGTLRQEVRPVYRLCLKTKYLLRDAPRNTVRFFILRRLLNENAEIQTNAVAASCDADVRYLYRAYKDGVSDTQIDNLKEKLYRGTATRADITRITRRLGDEIAHVYGFPIPRRQAPAQER